MKFHAILAVLMLVGVAASLPAAAQNTGPAPAPATAAPATPAPHIATAQPAQLSQPQRLDAHALTRADVSAWLDGFVPYALKRGDVAGAEVVIVKDGQVLFEKGYGFSDVKNQTPVDPKTTLFRPGSISKLFTWTAVMQLVEQGKINLDTDINTYLDFKIPPAFGKPITMRNLMTHTPGFEETIKNLISNDPKHMTSLGAALKAWVPERMFPPGQVSAYSNYGAALAGYIVQRVSGEKFEDYIQHHIFTPLRMNNSTFVQPLPKAMQGNMSKGYMTASGDAKPYELVPMSPAGALAATGDDMARFMLAHLNNGSYDGAQILKPETAKLMHSRIYQPGEAPLAMGLGFYHEDRNGHDIVGHGGDTVLFHSDLHLILDQGVGFYVTQNSAGGTKGIFRRTLFEEFMDRYFPAPAPKAAPTLSTAKAHGALVAGKYEGSRRSDSNFFRIANLFGQMSVSVNDDGTISVAQFTNLAGTPKKFREIAPFHWRQVNGRETLVAEMHGGKVWRLYYSEIPMILVLKPAAFWHSAAWNLPLFIAMFAMLALTVLFWPLKAILRWRYNAPFALVGREAWMYRLARLTALLDVIFLGGFIAFMAYGGDHLELMVTANDWMLRSLQAIGVLGALGTVFAIYNFVYAVKSSTRPWWTKVSDLLLMLACIAVVYFIFNLNLITPSLNY